MLHLLTLLLAAALPPGALAAQDLTSTSRAWAAFRPDAPASPRPGGPGSGHLPWGTVQEAEGERWAPVPVFLASLAVPGSGQGLLRQRRGLLYLAAEVAALVLHLDHRGEARELRARYRDLASEVALGGRPAPRVEGNFAFFERLTTWTRSGAFDADPERSGVQPETSPDTYNGSVWTLARDLYLEGAVAPDESHPAYAKALDYYRSGAYGPDLVWDWGSAPDAQVRYRSLLRDSDERFRTATTLFGVLLANHLLSAADAFFSARLRAARAGDAAVSLRLEPTPGLHRALHGTGLRPPPPSGALRLVVRVDGSP